MAEAKPWNATFRRIRAGYRTDWLYPPKPSASDLDAIEAVLNFRLPARYRAFAQQFGLDGTLEVLPNVLALTTPQWREKPSEWDSVVSATRYIQSDQMAEDLTRYGEPETPLDFFRRVVVFAIDGGYHTFVFDPAEVTDARLHECRIYDINRSNETTALVDSFGVWLDWVHEHYKFDEEEPE